VFGDECFWRRCPEHATDRKANAAFSEHKLQGNGDRRVERALADPGWRVIRSREHEPAEATPERMAVALVRVRDPVGG